MHVMHVTNDDEPPLHSHRLHSHAGVPAKSLVVATSFGTAPESDTHQHALISADIVRTMSGATRLVVGPTRAASSRFKQQSAACMTPNCHCKAVHK